MPPLSLPQIPQDATYVEAVDANFAAIQSFVNSLAAQLLAVSPEGAQLLLDTYDRPGLVGTHSYWLHTKTYTGGGEITIGRWPAPNVLAGELDISIAWGNFAGQLQRVEQNGDVVLSALQILNALPKTIYVGIPSSGTAQLYEDDTTPSVLYIYSMTWDGYQLKDFRRLGHYLPGYSLLQSLLKHAQEVKISDWETQWTGDELGFMSLPLHGSEDATEIGVNHAVEVIGGYIDIPKGGAGGFHAPSTVRNTLKLKLMSEGLKWNLGDLEINVANCPDRLYFQIDEAAVGDARFVLEPVNFRLERVAIGEHVASARGYTLGLFVRPIIGVPIPKDSDVVDQV